MQKVQRAVYEGAMPGSFSLKSRSGALEHNLRARLEADRLAKDRFADEPERYNRFLKTFTDIYGSNAPDEPPETRISMIRAEMRDIFRGNEDLLEGFESFVPEDGPGTDRSEKVEKVS